MYYVIVKVNVRFTFVMASRTRELVIRLFLNRLSINSAFVLPLQRQAILCEVVLLSERRVLRNECTLTILDGS